MSDEPLKAGALFSGIGGFCLGFEQAGIRSAWAVENDPMAVMTYSRNIKGVRLIENNGVPASVKDVGVLGKGGVVLDVQAGTRINVDIELNQEFFGALKVVAHEI